MWIQMWECSYKLQGFGLLGMIPYAGQVKPCFLKIIFFPPPLFFLNTPWWFFWKSQRCVQFITEIGRLYFPCVDSHFRLWWLQGFFFPLGVEILSGIPQPFCDIPASVAFLGVKVRWVESVFRCSNLQQTHQVVRFATIATLYWTFFLRANVISERFMKQEKKAQKWRVHVCRGGGKASWLLHASIQHPCPSSQGARG